MTAKELRIGGSERGAIHPRRAHIQHVGGVHQTAEDLAPLAFLGLHSRASPHSFVRCRPALGMPPVEQVGHPAVVERARERLSEYDDSFLLKKAVIG